MSTDGRVFLIKSSSDDLKLNELLDQFSFSYYAKTIALKANFNSADPFPASTDLRLLEDMIRSLQKYGSSQITLAERSGMGKTREVLSDRGVFKLAEDLGFDIVILDEEPADSWVKIPRKSNHWIKGFYIPRLFLEEDVVVQTCCLKTHRFGGHFTLSLKNSVGLVAKRIPGKFYDYMAELHVSPYQREMIAEINHYYPTDLVVMDARKAFISGGPDKGLEVEPGLILASRDRVAMDAVGVALLRLFGSEGKISKGPIFQQTQIRRASELGIGVEKADEIELIGLDDESQLIASQLKQLIQ